MERYRFWMYTLALQAALQSASYQYAQHHGHGYLSIDHKSQKKKRLINSRRGG